MPEKKADRKRKNNSNSSASRSRKARMSAQARAEHLENTAGTLVESAAGAHKKANGVRGKGNATQQAGKKAAPSKLFPIVGIGASAGGLEAMTGLLRHLPRNTGMAFVLVQHLDPTHESQLTALLSRLTPMAVSEAKNNGELERNHLYVIPPNKVMGIAGRRLKLLPRPQDAETHMAIDYFLRSLAEEEAASSIGVLLSGNGSDGTVGLQAIKAAGGITFAQDETSAKYPNMPGHAIAARCVDFVMPPDKIARELARIAGHPYVAVSEAVTRQPQTEERAFDDILATLRRRTGVDFTHYKRPTLERRIQRRMVLHRYDKLRDYATYVRGNAAEAKDLFNDVLIHVTSFFRDAAIFSALRKKVFPRMLKGKAPNDPMRIWVPGCSTGEEVYSVAITLLEALPQKRTDIPIQIFGTDINESALEKARSGFYPDSIRQDVSAERLRRFFVRHDSGYRINKAIREVCIFARQNVVVDPPFCNLDLISCRNVLIYLGQPLQRKIIPVLHYALRPEGLLVLGASETIGGFTELFELADRRAKVYVKKAGRVRPALSFRQPHFAAPEMHAPVPKPPEESPTIADIQKHADRILLANYSPAGVVINKDMDVIRFRGRTGPFLEHAQGEANLNLLRMAREGLAMDLRAAVSKAIRQNTRVRQEGARVRQNHHFVEVAIEVIPFQVQPSRERFYMVLLDTLHPTVEMETFKPRGRKSKITKAEAEMNHLREELSSSRESLQAIIEEQEATNEELRSANEEIMSSNEELQSTNEELETAKEELQSTNEELTTLNEELETRNVEMTRVNNDLENVMASVNIPMLILGRDLRIRRFTAMAEKLFNLIPADVGRPITDIATKAELPNLDKIIMEVIDTLGTREIETRDRDGHYWSVRIRPYKTTDNKIDGAVIALVDIDAIKANLKRSEDNRAFAEAIVNTVRHPLVVLDKNLVVQHVNDAFLRAFRVDAKETVEQPIYGLGNGQWDIRKLRELLEEILPKNTEFRDFEVEHDFPRVGKKKMLLNARRLLMEGDKKQMILLAIEDLSPPRP